MSIDKIKDFLHDHAGVTTKNLLSAVQDDQFSPQFFKPYGSKADPFLRASTIISAPVISSILSLGYLANGLFVSIVSLITAFHSTATAKISIKVSAELLLCSGLCFLSAFISPLANLIDLIGGGINKIKEIKESSSSTSESGDIPELEDVPESDDEFEESPSYSLV